MDSSVAPGSSDSPNHSEDVAADPAPDSSHARMQPGQRFVDRMPANPKKMVFMSTQEIFEVPLRPEHTSNHAYHRQQRDSDSGPSDSDFVNPPVAAASNRTRTSARPAPRKKAVPKKKARLAHHVRDGPELAAQSNVHADQTTPQKLNVRCNPADVLFTITLLSHNQYAALVALGFGPFLTMLTDAVESRNLLPWLLDRIKPNDMVLRVGPGKIIAVTPNIISMVLGIPHGGRNLKLYTTQEGRQFKKDLIKDLAQDCLKAGAEIYISDLQQEILKGNVDELFLRCFFMIVFNRYLFPTSTYKFDCTDIIKAKHPEDFGHVDWSQEVFNNLQFAIRRWHDRDRSQSSHTIYGCSIFLIVLYLDHLHHTQSPPDWLSTPRIRFYNKSTIESLTIVDRILNLDGTEEYGFLPFKSTSSTCYAAAALHHLGSDPAHFDQQQIPEVQLPRMRDLLSRPLGCLSGPTSHIVGRLFDLFDTTIMGNIKSIETLKLITLRSQLQLADQCRPILDDLLSSQQTTDHTDAGDCSTRIAAENDPHAFAAHQNDFPASPVMPCAPAATNPVSQSPFGSPITIHKSGPTMDVQGRDALSVQTSSFAGDITFSKETPITPRPNVVPDHDFLGKTSTFLTDHSKSNSSCAMSLNLDDAIGATNSLHCPTIPVNAATRSSHCAANDGSSPTPNHLPTVTTQPSTDSPSKDTPQSPTTLTPPPESKCGEGPTTDSVAPVAPIPEKRVPWRRLTKVPPKYCSPFKFGVKSRKPPDRVRSLSMLDYVCDYDSPLKNLPVMRFAKMDFSGELIANSFFHENFIQSHFVTAFVECLSFDDFHERPECHGYRIFLDPMVSSCLYDGSMERDTQDPGFMMQEAVHLIKQCLPNNCDLKKAKMIFLPILARRQWSVYCVNLGQRRIDVLDSKDYSQCNTTWQEYHDTLGNTIIPRLSDALNLAAPRQFISFIHWRHAPVQLAYHSNDNDSGVFAIRFLEYYDGEGHGSLKTTVHPDRSMEMRADILHYLCFHSNNGISPIPDALLKFRDV